MPPRINVYHDLPFAIMRYDPTDEWELRREIKLLATRLEAVGKEVHIIPMSELLWSALREGSSKRTMTKGWKPSSHWKKSEATLRPSSR